MKLKKAVVKCSVWTSTFQVSVLVMCHTRELAFQISKEYERFSKFLPAVKVRIVVLLSWLLSLAEVPRCLAAERLAFLYLC